MYIVAGLLIGDFVFSHIIRSILALRLSECLKQLAIISLGCGGQVASGLGPVRFSGSWWVTFSGGFPRYS